MSARVLSPRTFAAIGLLCMGPRPPSLTLRWLRQPGIESLVQSSVVTSEVQEAIAEGRSDAAKTLRDVIDTNDAFRIYHRDHQVLMAMTTRKNLFVGQKRAGERLAGELVRDVLQAKFSHLLATDNGFEGLDRTAMRVVFIEPDAFEDCPGRRSTRLGGGTGASAPVAFGGSGLWSNGWATPAPCTNCR